MEMTDSESDSDSLEHHCVSRRCQLCRFMILPGEAVIADVNSQLSSEFCNTVISHYDQNLSSIFQLCSHLCSHYDGLVPGYHASCLAYASCVPSRDSLRAIAYSYEPGPFEARKRRCRIRVLLAGKIKKVCGLPGELCSLTADQLVRASAISTAQELWQSRSSSGGEFDISRGLWADYVNIDGVRYVANLFDKPSGTSSSTVLLRAEKAPSVQVLYVLEDHLGVRQLLFTTLRGRVRRLGTGVSRQGQWWRTVAFPPPARKLKAESDGLKIRSVMSVLGPDPRNMTWTTPMAPSELEQVYLQPYSPDSALPLQSYQMAALECNGPDVTGYSACWAGNLLLLHAHHHDEDLACYRDLGDNHGNAMWIHMPLEPGELLSEVWVRRGFQYAQMAMTLVTTKGKRMTVGAHTSALLRLRNKGVVPEWRWLCSLPRRPCRIFFNVSDRGVHWLGVLRSALGGQTHPPRPLSFHPFSSPRWTSSLTYFYSVAELSDVVEITPCQVRLATYSPVIGLLLRYADGSRACVGQFRLDAAGMSLRVDPSHDLRLGFAVADAIPVHAAAVEVCDPLRRRQGERLRWESFPWRGRMEWWFMNGHSEVYHEERIPSSG
ncbi:hypothetical protein VTK73DRAFT_6190 [Phialemonium thermophilum]|uniref:Uncharacterized protein n=1 Tax=Phialemonium thermophilum TaxID=223376 RepID=A0ABR3WKB8_9PEZI